jgi:hypothetical protein
MALAALKNKLAEAGVNLSFKLVRKRQHLSHIVQLTEGNGPCHLHSLGQGLQLFGLPGE